MALIVDCPSCSRKLRVPEDLLGQKVRCPTCGQIFDAVEAPVAPAPTPRAAGPSVPSPFPPAEAEGASGEKPQRPLRGFGYVEVADEKGEPAPRPPDRPPPRAAEDDDADFRPWEHGQQRRDCEPHRGTTVLVLGILSLILPVLGLGLGIAAWVMGQGDLRKMATLDMDVAGRSSTQAGWVCGIIGTVLNALFCLSCGALFSLTA